MADQSTTDVSLPQWTQKTTADDMVRIVRRLLEAEGRTTTRRGRAQLRAAYNMHIKSFDQPHTKVEQAGVISQEAAARKLIELAEESNVFVGFSRAGYVVMENMVEAAERKAEKDKVCPAWPFC